MVMGHKHLRGSQNRWMRVGGWNWPTGVVRRGVVCYAGGMKRFLSWGGVVGMLLLVLGAAQWPDDNLHIVACDVGQGDATLLIQGSTQVVVDGGPSPARLAHCLEKHMPFWDRTIELMVVTHPQFDHFNGLTGVVRGYTVVQLLANNVSSESEAFAEFRQAVLEAGVPVHAPIQGERVRAGELELRVLWPQERRGSGILWETTTGTGAKNCIILQQETGSCASLYELTAYEGDLNEVSIVLSLTFGQVDVLLTGDMGTREEQALVGAGLITPVEVLKVAHHGSKYSSSQEFLEAAKPRLALIMVGRDNRFGHPTSDTLMRLDRVGARVLRTDELGTVELVTDGERVWGE